MKQTLKDHAYRGIVEMILAGQFEPGQPIRERLVAGRLGISTTPVREAFGRLEREGWVQIVSGQGCRLRRYSLEEIYDLYVLRESIEVALVPLILERASEEDWVYIKVAMEEFELQCTEKIEVRAGAQAGGRLLNPLDLDVAFHLALAKAGHSSRLLELIETTHLQVISMAVVADRENRPDQLEQTCQEHRIIFNALSHGQLRLAQEAVRSHISAACDQACRGPSVTNE